MAKATTFRTDGRSSCVPVAVAKLFFIPTTLCEGVRVRPIAVVGRAPEMSCPRLGEGDAPGFGSVVDIVSFALYFFF